MMAPFFSAAASATTSIHTRHPHEEEDDSPPRPRPRPRPRRPHTTPPPPHWSPTTTDQGGLVEEEVEKDPPDPEMAFVLLRQTPVRIRFSAASSSSSSSSSRRRIDRDPECDPPPHSTAAGPLSSLLLWHRVQLVAVSANENEEETKEKEKEEEEKEEEQDGESVSAAAAEDDVTPCDCILLTETTTTTTTTTTQADPGLSSSSSLLSCCFQIQWKHISPFSGRLADMYVMGGGGGGGGVVTGDAKHRRQSQPQPRPRRRSDASLLLGLLRSVEWESSKNGSSSSSASLSLVRIRHCWVQILPSQQPNHPQHPQQQHSNSKPQLRYCNLLVTLTFPYLYDSQSSSCSTPATTTMRKRQPRQPQQPPPPLSEPMQLLLSISRSDWESLVEFSLSSAPQQQHASTSSSSSALAAFFFPSQMSLDALYRQLPNHHHHYHHNHIHHYCSRGKCSFMVKPAWVADQATTEPLDSDREKDIAATATTTPPAPTTTATTATLASLPYELVRERIVALYLTAPDVHALQCCSRALHAQLVTVVPGLTTVSSSRVPSSWSWSSWNVSSVSCVPSSSPPSSAADSSSSVSSSMLHLYRHQRDSLQWMRRRECRPISEANLLLRDRCRSRRSRRRNNNCEEDCDCHDDGEEDVQRRSQKKGEDEHRAASGGYTVELQKKPLLVLSTTAADAALFPFLSMTITSKPTSTAAVAAATTTMAPSTTWVRISAEYGNEFMVATPTDDDDNTTAAATLDTAPTAAAIQQQVVFDHSRRVARGGLLCDDPGLGKTITILALILQTWGLSTVRIGEDHSTTTTTTPTTPPSTVTTTTTTIEASQNEEKKQDVDMRGEDPEMMDDPHDETVFHLYWTEIMTAEFRVPALNTLFNRQLQLHNYHHRLAKSRSSRGQSAGGGRGDPVQVQIALIRKAIQKDDFRSNFSLFEKAVDDAMDACKPDDLAPAAIESRHQRQSQFQSFVQTWKQSQIKSAKKSFSNASGRHKTTRLAAVIAYQAQQLFLKRLIPSCGTLLVIPRVLMEHWQSQILSHVDMRYVSRGKIPLIFEFHQNGNHNMSIDRAQWLCQVSKTHLPFMFLDRGSVRPLPPASFLAMFRIVITSTDRFKNEWLSGSFQNELRRPSIEESNFFRCNYYTSFDSLNEASSLLKVHWLRLVVDEGHFIGKGSQTSSTIQFASWITAQRRWAMTGTPTKQSGCSELGQIRGLLNYLQHDFFGRQNDGCKWWRDGIVKPWREGSLVGFYRLKSLLSLLMKRHNKLDIIELPPPHFKDTFIPMSLAEVTTYNTLVCGVQSNILLTSMQGKTSGKMDSLLHKSQSQRAKEALGNIRRVCVGWSRLIPVLSLGNFHETISLLESHGFSKEKVEEIRQYLFRPEDEILTPCGCCGLQLLTPLLLPCCGGHICPECMDDKSNRCLLCDKEFDVDDFQRLQPGFELIWKSNLDQPRKVSPALVKKPSVQLPLLPLPVPHRDIIIRPTIHPLDAVPRRTRKAGDGHVCEYNYAAGDGVCRLCLERHNACHLFNDQSRCPVCHCKAQECPHEESKAFYLVDKLCQLLKEHQQRRDRISRRRDDPFLVDCRPPKVIVYSQFRQALNVVGDRLLKRFGDQCIAEYWGRYRVQELFKFTTIPECFCMLLSNDGSEGLDLSFVSHIFFLEEIWDARLRDQAVARAWRMGAKGRVEVETLLAQNSVEETMREMESNVTAEVHYGSDTEATGKCSSSSTALDRLHSVTEYQHAKTKKLLQSLRLMSDFHSFVKNSESSWVNCENKVSLPTVKSPDQARSSGSSLSMKRRIEGDDQEKLVQGVKRVRFQ